MKYILLIILLLTTYSVQAQQEFDIRSERGICFVQRTPVDIFEVADIRSQGTLDKCKSQLIFNHQVLFIPTDFIWVINND